MRRRVLILVPALTVAAAAVAAVTGRRGAAPASLTLTGPPATAAVTRRTLTRRAKVAGTLGYGSAAPVLGGGGGMITWLPGEGAVLARGDTVYRVDQVRVPLLYGEIPIYRTLSPGRTGGDVRQLERNLRALGYAGFTADGEYTAATAAAVRDWQRRLGRPRTGVVRPGDAVVAPGARRVAQVVAVPGAAAGGILLKWTGTARIVAADLDIGYADLIRAGTAATVELPDGGTAPARVTRVGAPTTTNAVPIELTVPDRRGLGGYQTAEVSVEITAETRRDVLAVPVEALVARPGGGYGVVSGGRTVPVRTGLFADGYVEVSGVAEGLTVGVPR